MFWTWKLFILDAARFPCPALRHSASRWLTRLLFSQAASAGIASKARTATASAMAANGQPDPATRLRGCAPPRRGTRGGNGPCVAPVGYPGKRWGGRRLPAGSVAGANRDPADRVPRRSGRLPSWTMVVLLVSERPAACPSQLHVGTGAAHLEWRWIASPRGGIAHIGLKHVVKHRALILLTAEE